MVTSPSDLVSAGSPYDGQALASNEIRLLTIKSISTTSQWEDHGRNITREPPEVSLELRTHGHELTEDLDYDAVSYVWGIAPASVTIMCNGRPLAITPVALEMLRYLHRYQAKTTARKIWIDAICINQKDDEEKSTQIPLMRDIYSRAATVIVWMGLSTAKIDVFFTEFQDVREKLRVWKALYDSDPDCRDPIEEECPCDVYAFWGGLSQILKKMSGSCVYGHTRKLFFQIGRHYFAAILGRTSKNFYILSWMDISEAVTC